MTDFDKFMIAFLVGFIVTALWAKWLMRTR